MGVASTAGNIIGGIGGILQGLGVGGSSAKTDRSQYLDSVGKLLGMYTYGANKGGDYTASGEDSLGDVGNYYHSILSGNREATEQAVAPTIDAANQQTDATKRAIATSGTARGGGVNATTLGLDTGKQATIDNAITAVKPQAAAGEESVAQTQLSEAMQLLGLSTGAITNVASLASKNRPVDFQIGQAASSEAGQGLASLLKGLFPSKSNQ